MPFLNSGQMLRQMFALPRLHKRLVQVTVDTALLIASFAAAMALRLETLTFLLERGFWLTIAITLPATIAVFIHLGFYRAIIRYMTNRAVLSLSKGIAASGLVLALAAWGVGADVPRSVPVLYVLLAFCTVGGIRFMLRALFQRAQNRAKVRVIIHGAGQSGQLLAQSLFQGPDYLPVAIIDPNPEMQGAQVAGLMVFSPDQLPRLIDDYSARLLLLSDHSMTRQKRAEILASLADLPIHVQSVPSFEDQISGRAGRENLRDLSIDDLVGRHPVRPDPDLLSRTLTGKVVMVTGAGGTVGSELCLTILRQSPQALVLVENSEVALYEISARLQHLQGRTGGQVHLHALLADVADEPRILSILRQHLVETLFHAAAYKHVPIVEENPIAGLRNNVLGTLATARAAVQAGVSNFTLVSTDKAVRPTSIMGASKRLAELVCQMVGAQATGTRFSIVRFGNVMGSSGSVIPLFKRQIAAGGPVEVTHPQVARYFMTMSEAAELVIQAGAMPGTSGDVHVLDMGEQVNILSLARRMILLSGFRPVITTDQNKDQPRKPDEIRITFIGLRTGEKVTEELLAGPGARATIHPRIFSAKERGPALATIVPVIDRIAKLSGAETPDDIRSILQSADIGYGLDTSASAETLTLNTPTTR